MTARQDWDDVSARIRGVLELAQSPILDGSNAYNPTRALYEQNGRTLEAIKAYREKWAENLPDGAAAQLKGFIERHTGLITDKTPGPLLGERARTAVAFLLALDGEMKVLLRDVQYSIRLLSERAFVHLQRSIYVDRDLRARWQEAFDTNERTCEQLGSVHLLLHGIWAFKLDATKARTDLMFDEPILDVETIERSATGLVLTEWKICGDGDGKKEFDQAVRQCHEYASGALGGVELRNYRYAVVVSDDRLTEPADIIEGDLRIRHINIAVRPSTPSKVARSSGR